MKICLFKCTFSCEFLFKRELLKKKRKEIKNFARFSRLQNFKVKIWKSLLQAYQGCKLFDVLRYIMIDMFLVMFDGVRSSCSISCSIVFDRVLKKSNKNKIEQNLKIPKQSVGQLHFYLFWKICFNEIFQVDIFLSKIYYAGWIDCKPRDFLENIFNLIPHFFFWSLPL